MGGVRGVSHASLLTPAVRRTGGFFIRIPRRLKISDIMILCFFILLFFSSSVAIAQRGSAPDDTLLYVFSDIVTISATRLPVQLSHAPAAIDVFESTELRLLPVATLSDLLPLVAGASIRDYGGTGSLQLASLRGLGAEYTVIYLDGIRMNDAQSATVDVGRLSLRHVDRVEIARGGFASLYGTNALGGVINILSRQVPSPPTIEFGFGSFGWKRAMLGGGANGKLGRMFVNLGYEEADNDFDFIPQWGGNALIRENASVLRRSAGMSGTLALASSTVTIHTDILDSRVGAPGPLLSTTQGRAMQHDTRGMISTRFVAPLAGGLLTLGTGTVYTRQEYHDPAVIIGGVALDSRHDNTRLALTSSYEIDIRNALRLSIGMEAMRDVLNSDEVRVEAKRHQASLYAAADIPLRIADTELRLYPALRFDSGTDQPDERAWNVISPSVAAHLYILPDAVAIRGRISRCFSAPTFNQLYWRDGGNSDLRPEFSTAFDAGVRLTTKVWLEQADISVFHHDITDKIVWMPSGGLWWFPRNIQHVVSNGVEVSLRIRVASDALRLRLSGQWIDARKRNAAFAGDATQNKRLIYVPVYGASAGLTARLSQAVSAVLTQRISGQRYYTEINDASLPPYTVTDIALHFATSFASMRTFVKFELLNAFDSSYEVIAFYPTPGRHVRGILTTEL